MLNQLLKQYDKYLGCKKHLDGSITIFRQSPYTTIKFDVLTVTNQYSGSFKWLMRKIVLMDSRRKDFIVSSINKNKKQRQIQKDSRQSREVAEFMLHGGMTFIN